MRYVIDYYFNEDKAGTAGQFDLVVRPAADDASSVLDRVKMTVYAGCATVGIPCPISGNNGAIGKEGGGAQHHRPGSVRGGGRGRRKRGRVIARGSEMLTREARATGVRGDTRRK